MYALHLTACIRLLYTEPTRLLRRVAVTLKTLVNRLKKVGNVETKKRSLNLK